MKKFLSVVLAASMLLMCLVHVQGAGEQRPFPQHTVYYSGVIKPNHVTQTDLDNAVKSFYDAWKARYLVAVSGSNPTQKYVFYNKEGYASPSNAVSCSEGHGYGMLIAALMAGYDANAKSDFDALYRFYKAHPSSVNSKLMAWQQVNSSGNIIDNPSGGTDSAIDGDMDIAYSLLLADKQWGSSGSINYRTEAIAVIQAIMSSEVNQSEWILKLGDWVSNSDSTYGKATRPSDFMLSHLKAFADADTANTAKWNNVFNKTCSIINYQYNSGGSANTGLMPDFMKNSGGNYVPVTGTFLEDGHDGDYNYNSCRTPWRFPIDYLLTGDSTIKSQLMTLNTWIKSKTGSNPSNIKNGYYVKNGTNGNAFGTGNELCFTAPFAVSAMIDSSNQAWLNSLWDKMVSTSITSDAYFGNSIKMLCMITVSGNWWTPASGGPVPTPTPTPTPTPGSGNLAQGKTATASSSWSSSYDASKAVDANDTTRWSAASGQTVNQWLAVDLGSGTTYDKVILKEISFQRVTSYKLQSSNDGTNYTDIAGTSGTSIGASKTITFSPVTSRYIRLYVSTASDVPTINEVEVYYIGAPTPTPTPTPTLTPTPGPVWNSTMSYSAGTHNLGSNNTGIRTTEFDLTPLADGIDGLVGYADTSTTVATATNLAMITRTNVNGSFEVRNGAAYAAMATVLYSANNTYHFKMVTDLNARTYSVWVTPPGGSPIQIANNYAFRSDAPATDDLGQVCVRTAGADNQMTVANHIVY